MQRASLHECMIPAPPNPHPPLTHPKAAPLLLFTAAWWLASSMKRYTAVAHKHHGGTQWSSSSPAAYRGRVLSRQCTAHAQRSHCLLPCLSCSFKAAATPEQLQHLGSCRVAVKATYSVAAAHAVQVSPRSGCPSSVASEHSSLYVVREPPPGAEPSCPASKSRLSSFSFTARRF